MNKESIFRQLEQRIVGRPLTAEALGEFNAMAIADSLKQKRSIISHHLNNLHREQRVVKVNGRPVLFLPIAALRDHHRRDTVNLNIIFGQLNAHAASQHFNRPFRGRVRRNGFTPQLALH